MDFFRFNTQSSTFKTPGHMNTLELKTWPCVYHSHGARALRTPAVGAGGRLHGGPPPHSSWHLLLLPPLRSERKSLFPPGIAAFSLRHTPSLGLAWPFCSSCLPVHCLSGCKSCVNICSSLLLANSLLQRPPGEDLSWPNRSSLLVQILLLGALTLLISAALK